MATVVTEVVGSKFASQEDAGKIWVGEWIINALCTQLIIDVSLNKAQSFNTSWKQPEDVYATPCTLNWQQPYYLVKLQGRQEPESSHLTEQHFRHLSVQKRNMYTFTIVPHMGFFFFFFFLMPFMRDASPYMQNTHLAFGPHVTLGASFCEQM